jgi:hypothetical protein
MKTPRLEIYLDEKSDLCIGKVERPDSEPRLIFDIELSELNSYGVEEASKKVGEVILRILKIWHKETFENLEAFSFTEKEDDDDFVMAMQLIGKSVSTKTKAHVQTIEILLRQQAIKTEAVQKFVDESWPSIRANLESYTD